MGCVGGSNARAKRWPNMGRYATPGGPRSGRLWITGPRCPSPVTAASARALDGDNLLAATAGADRARCRHRTGDLAAVDLAERRRLAEVARLAIGGRDGDAAGRARRQTPVDAVAVGIVGNDE